MIKLIKGIIDFRKTTQESYREAFGRLATGQAPDSLFIACSDSRVVPNTFASTNPGDLFVIRNVGNLIPPSDFDGHSSSDESEAAAIEFAILNLNVKDIIVCGHSECGAMRALLANRQRIETPNLKNWLRHADMALKQLQAGAVLDPLLEPHNQLSQLNVLLQMKHIASYPPITEKLKSGQLAIHGWWFDLVKADVYAYEKDINKFVLIDETAAERIIARLSKR